ncbi:unnamed protein product [Microthlaspi erraticum]|uniref:UDP-glycosyltransferases domain-containing protein n=1 Tax=Microthlaspi erraticum TaxID=1685480 RepID=A0A6D2KE24_9BRAS|nr:unnamed protein product [Microthlaspi erraticum]
MEKKSGHVLAVPYPTQGHITPIHQFCKRLVSKGLKTTLALTTFVFNSIKPDPSGPISIATISDGYDHGFQSAGSIDEYLQNFKTSAPKPLQTSSANTRLVITPSLVSRCAVNYVYYLSYINHGSLKLPVRIAFLELQDLPSFISVPGSYPAYFEMVLQQFTNFEKADFVLVNTFQELDLHMEELASAISNFSFLWVVRPSEEAKLPLGFLETVDKDKSLVLKWSPQLEVLSNKAIGCFLTHCGWNSTMEA